MVISTDAVTRYLETPEQLRPGVGFKASFLDSADAFTVEQAERLSCLARNQRPFDARTAERLLIDLSWASSALEGGSYSQLETIALVDWGQKNPAKPNEDAVMILNHKQAIEILLRRKEEGLSIGLLQELHKALADPRDTKDSRHFLSLEQGGLLRQYGDVRISGSSYFPSGTMGLKLEAHLNKIIDVGTSEDAINAAFYVMTRLPYLQPFFDANKRTSRLAANIPLMNAGLTPFSYIGMDRSRYHQGLVAFYELGHEGLLRDAFVEAYSLTAVRERITEASIEADARVAFVNDQAEIAVQLREFVLEAVKPVHPLLQATVLDCLTSPSSSSPGL